VLQQVDDNTVDRHPRHQDQGNRSHPVNNVRSRIDDHLVDQMVGTHMGEGNSSVTSGGDDGRVGGFLQHGAYLLNVVVWSWVDRCSGWCGVTGVPGAGGSAAQVEVDGDAHLAGGPLSVHDRRVEAPLLGGGDRGTVQVAVAAGLLHRHVDDVAV